MADYPGVLADLRGRISLLDQERKELEIAIAAIERICGASGANASGTQRLLLPTIESAATVGGGSGFRGMRMPEAIAKHFEAARTPQTVRQIVEALRGGGFEGSSQNLRGHVYNTLHRLQRPNGPYVHKADGLWTREPFVSLTSFVEPA